MNDPAYPDALPALSRLHWYVLERVLGQGAFGITYLAKDTNLDQRVAIKEYLPIDVATRMQDATVRSRTEELRDRYRWGLERFIQEARTLARFDHPNIVRVLSVFEFNNTAYMVMRFEEGGTLAALLDRRGTLSEPDLLRILVPILNGLELVHGAGFTHRDIKPDNIHIGADGRPVLLDFGSARQSLGNSHSLTILVAPGYAPFEQYYSDPSSQGPWTDIYGLAATCYRAICGRAPLDAVSRSKGILGSTQEVMVPASVIGAGHYSGRVLAAIDHALAFGEKDRPQTIAEWRQELIGDGAGSAAVPAHARGAAPAAVAAATAPTLIDAAKPTRTSPSPPTAVVEPVSRVSSRGPWTGALIAAAVAVIAVAVTVYAVMAGRSDETQSKIALLEKQIRDKDAADAERERKAKQQAEDDARQRKAQEQARAEEEKTRPEPARKAEPAPRQSQAAARPRDEPAAKRPPKAEAQIPAPPASGAPAATTAIASSAQPPASGTPPPATAAPEPPKPAARAPAEHLADADRAIAAQRYADAIAILKPLADAGNAQAQTRMGDAYAEGHGVTRNLTAGERWYEKAALQGDTAAQIKLGAMFADGRGVPQNNNLAYVWYGTAARLGSTSAKTERDKLVSLLQPAEKDQLDKLIASKVEGMAKKP
jgi:serine/threonine protein kinase/TPR repeat protein